MATAWKKYGFILSEKSDFHMVDNLSIEVHAFLIHMLISLSVDEILLPIAIGCMCNWVYLVLPSFYSGLVYHGYEMANIGPWRGGI